MTSDPYDRHLTTQLLVAKPIIEKQGQPVNAQDPGRIAALTRGASFTTDNIDLMAAQISLLPNPSRWKRESASGANPLGAGSC